MTATTAPTLGWIAIDRASVARVRAALEGGEQGVVDELGVGALHAGYADHFFPGTSVLQTRARYLFFVPWTFLHLARKRVTRDALTKKKRDVEQVLTEHLIAHHRAEGGTRNVGILGVRVHPKPPAQPPDFVYWTALHTWGLHAGRPRSSLLHRWDARAVLRSAEAGPPGEEDVASEHLAVFDVPPPPEEWPGGFAGGFDLSAAEAEWIRVRWARLRVPSLLRELGVMLKEGHAPAQWKLWDDPMAQEAARRADAGASPKALPSFVAAVERARLGSSAAEVVRATYGAYVEAAWRRDRLQATGVEGPSLGYDDRLADYFGPKSSLRDDLLRLDVAALTGDLPAIARSSRRLDELLVAFQRAWRAAKRPGDILGDERLRQACELAERRLKGPRARLPRDVGKERRADFTAHTVRAVGIDYRWPTTHRLMADVHEGLRRG